MTYQVSDWPSVEEQEAELTSHEVQVDKTFPVPAQVPEEQALQVPFIDDPAYPATLED